ncbi:MAG: hypothetical protein JOZ75_05410 [Candidatus Dormibacteraeota bacterium]|nr:hypothetical protein [Candidatus Dormibacteraeota bacterium]
MTETTRARYRFGPLERRGVILGLRPGQIAAVGIAVVLVVILLRSSSGSLGLPLAVLTVIAAFAFAFVPIAGRSVEEWSPIAVRYLARRVTGGHRYVSHAPLVGRVAGDPAAHAPLPQALGSLEILAAPVQGGTLGVAKDSRAGTYTAVLATRGRSFVLLDPSDKARRLAAFGAVLKGLARESGVVSRVQLLERTLPDDSDGVMRYMADAAALPPASEPYQAYAQLIEDAGAATQAHEACVALTVDARRASRAIRLAGGGDQGACTVLARRLTSLTTELQAGEVMVTGVLTPRLLAESMRLAFDPAARAQLAARAAQYPQSAGTAPANAWPMATETNWDTYRTDSAWHATYWISELPRVDVGPDWLVALLLQTTVPRTVAVTMEPIPPLRSHRDIEHARIADMTDESLRQRHGFRTSFRKLREAENAERREQELADGYADFRFSAYITVSAPSAEELELACGEVEQRANECALDLRRMNGEQDEAFTYTLPLGRGLR